MWFGTLEGVSRYDGKEFVTLTQNDGLAGNSVTSIAFVRDKQAGRDLLYFGTGSGGISFTDGVAWSTLDTRDGLAGNSIRAIFQDRQGAMWFGTENGVTRYQQSSTRPRVRILSAKTDVGDLDADECRASRLSTSLAQWDG